MKLSANATAPRDELLGAVVLLVFFASACGGKVSSTSGSGGASGVGGARPDGGVGSGGSGSGSGGANGSGGAASGSGGSSSGSGGGSAGAGGGSSTTCSVTLMPQINSNLVPGVGSKVRMVATLGNNRSGRKPTWMWNATFEYATPPKVLTVMPADEPDAQTSIVDVPIAEAGSYKISADSGLNCSAQNILVVNRPRAASYLFRITPPPSLNINVPVQERQQVLSLERDCGGTPAPCIDPINLEEGDRLSIQPVDPSSRALSAIVRVTLRPLTTTMDGYTSKGPFEVVLLRNTSGYEVLIVPDGQFAPRTFFNVTGASLPSFPIDPGTSITGTVVDGMGNPLVGARVALAVGTRPSTLGVSDESGKFSLWTRSGAHSVRIIPPPAAGLPEARLTADTTIPIDFDATIQIAWKKFVQAPLSVTVKSMDGSQPKVGSRVRADGLEPLTGVATVTGLGAAPVSLSGSVHSEVVTDENGLARFPNLPLGTYDITIVPPPVPTGIPDEAITVEHVVLTSIGYTATIPLRGHINISGIFLPEGLTTGARVYALDQTKGITAPVVSTIVGANGEYSLQLDPSRVYLLVADPAPDSPLTRTIKGKDVPAKDSIAGPFSLDKAAFAQGTVMSGYRRIAGALVQVYCFAAPVDVQCLDPTLPVAEALTRADGTYTVKLPRRP